MPQVEIYTTPICPFCMRAKMLLQKKGVTFDEIDVLVDYDRRQEMARRSDGATSVPQIFIDGQHIGGCDELYELDFDDELDPLLGLE